MVDRDPGVDGLPEQIPEFYQTKAHWVRSVTERPMDGLSPDALPYAAHTYRAILNTQQVVERGGPMYQEVRDYFEGERTDVFALYQRADQLVEAISQGSQGPDAADMLITAHYCNRALLRIIEDVPDRPGVRERYRELIPAVFLATLRRTQIRQRDVDVYKYTGEMYDYMLGDLADSDTMAVMIGMFRDRLHLMNFIDTGELSRQDYEQGRRNFYNKPAKPEARHQLNVHAAEVIERLHLLKEYPIVSMEVAAERVGLPWNIIGTPPTIGLEGEYAEGAVADFYFMDPSQQAEELSFYYEKVGERQMAVTIGGAAPRMRFRLHDDGHLTHGLQIHNVPNDDTEAYFRDMGADEAFERLRDLLIAMAFDAQAPEEGVPDTEVRGSVGTSFMPPGESMPPLDRLIKILLRRRRALERANITPENPRPEHWPRPLPTRNVRGYFMKMREGYRARADAEMQARQYHRDRGLRWPGWRETHTWVPPHRRPGDRPEVTRRRAYFRSTSETARSLGNLGVTGRGRRRRR